MSLLSTIKNVRALVNIVPILTENLINGEGLYRWIPEEVTSVYGGNKIPFGRVGESHRGRERRL